MFARLARRFCRGGEQDESAGGPGDTPPSVPPVRVPSVLQASCGPASPTHLEQGLLLRLPCLGKPGIRGLFDSSRCAPPPAPTVELLQHELAAHLPWAATVVLTLACSSRGSSTTAGAGVYSDPSNHSKKSSTNGSRCSCEASCVFVSEAFQALFQVRGTDTCDAFIERLLHLHPGAQAFFTQQVQDALRHSRCGASVSPGAVQSIELGGPHGLALSVQPLTLATSSHGSSHQIPSLALILELAFRNTATSPLLRSTVRADRCSHGQGELCHMFSMAGGAVLHQSPASQAYLGLAWTGLEQYLGLPSRAIGSSGGGGGGEGGGRIGAGGGGGSTSQQIGADDDIEVHMSGHRRRGAQMDTSTNWLHKLFVLDMGSLEQMMAETARGRVWRYGWGGGCVGGRLWKSG